MGKLGNLWGKKTLSAYNVVLFPACIFMYKGRSILPRCFVYLVFCFAFDWFCRWALLLEQISSMQLQHLVELASMQAQHEQGMVPQDIGGHWVACKRPWPAKGLGLQKALACKRS